MGEASREGEEEEAKRVVLGKRRNRMRDLSFLNRKKIRAKRLDWRPVSCDGDRMIDVCRVCKD